MIGSKEKSFEGSNFALSSEEDSSLNLKHLPKYLCYKAAALKEKKTLALVNLIIAELLGFIWCLLGSKFMHYKNTFVKRNSSWHLV